MENDEDVRAPLGMVDEDNRPTRSSRTEIVERWRLHKVLEPWDCLYLGSELAALRQKLPMGHHESADVVHPLAVFVSIIVVIHNCTRKGGHCQRLEFPIYLGELVYQMGIEWKLVD